MLVWHRLGASVGTRCRARVGVRVRAGHGSSRQRVDAESALSAVLFLYRIVLSIPIRHVDGFVRARVPARLPVVLTRTEVSSVLSHLDGQVWLIVSLLYGAGLRLQEALELPHLPALVCDAPSGRWV